jgi:DNA-binding NtrC family response regulator
MDILRSGKHKVRVLLFSPDIKLQSLLSSALKSEYEVLLESSKERLKVAVKESGADILVLDFDSNYATLEEHLEFYSALGESHIPTVVMTDDMRRSTATEFMERGAHDCIRKPPSLVEFKVIVGRAYEHALMKQELESMRLNMSLTHGCDRLVGSSGRAQVVYDLIRRLANLNAFVLITGESGTGKELVAKALHSQSNRAGHPFSAVSCGAIPESLIEAELFGHERGAFTGSTGARAGYLEQAGNGTILLDEIGELSLNTQVKLLRVLQQKEFSRIGSNKLIPLNARVLFATHRNLQQMVEAGTFRRDLYYRVNVMGISVPPLRERTEDIPLLARHFLRQYAVDFGKAVHDIRPSAMEALVEYEWPGNIRELENVIQSAVILADGGCITLNELPDYLRQLTDEEAAASVSSDRDGFEGLMRQYKIDLANNAILECNGNKTLAAKKLRVSRAYLHRLIRLAPESGDMPPANVTLFRTASSAS